MAYSHVYFAVLLGLFGVISDARNLRKHGATKITGGTAVDITDVPYMADIEFLGRFACPAVIISPQWVATSAICMDLLYEEDIIVRTGSTEFEAGGHLYPVQTIVRHPLYEDNFQIYDFALVQVALDITLNNATKVVPIATAEPVANAQGRVSGWGAVADGSILHRTLLAADLPIYNRTECVQRLPDNPTDQWICTLKDGSGPCEYDEGDPLVVNNSLVGTKVWLLDEQCGDPNKPSPYINIANPVFRDFIRTTAGV